MRLGLLGGTFDPIHLGHLLLAEQALEELELDRFLLIPAGSPPHKPKRPITAYADRFAMARLALAGDPRIEVSRREEDEAHASYTVDTLARLSAEFPGAELWLLLGGDSLRDLPSWHRPEEILQRASIAMVPRPGETLDPPVPAGTRLKRLHGPRIHLSASEIRERIRSGRSIRYLVPDPVRDYIARERLYQDR